MRRDDQRLNRAASWALPALLTMLAFAAGVRFFSTAARAQSPDTIQVYSRPSTTATPASVEKFTLTGTVVDSVTGEPIRKALVQLYTGQRRMTFSGDDGRFQLEGIPAGSYSVSAQKPGYFSQQELLRSGTPPVEVGPKSSSAIVKLTPEAILSGKVTSTAGIPLEHVSLRLNYIEIREGRRRWDFKGIAMTDEDGRYRFANLRPGDYYLSAAPYTPLADTLLEPDEPPKTGYAGAYYPGLPDLASASPLQLAAGEQSEANLTLTEVPVYAISGTVSGYAPNQGVVLQVFDQSGVQVDQGVQVSPENGRFDVRPLAAGNYVIKAFSSLGPNQTVRAEARITLTADLHNLHLALAPAPSIPVVVQMESVAQRPKNAAAFTRPINAGPPVSVRLTGAGPGTNEAYASFDSPDNPRTLSLRNVEVGRHTAIIDARENWYVASAEYGQTDLLTDDLVLTPGAPPQTMNIVLRNDSASIAGTVHAPDSFKGNATIIAVPERLAKASCATSYWSPPRDKNSEPGGFVLDGLAPGDYLVFAFDHAEGLEYTNRDVMENYLSQAAHVTLSPNQRAKVTLELIRTGEDAN
jgi:Carboxypeptidase regulatory-like domain